MLEMIEQLWEKDTITTFRLLLLINKKNITVQTRYAWAKWSNLRHHRK